MAYTPGTSDGGVPQTLSLPTNAIIAWFVCDLAHSGSTKTGTN